MPIGVLWNITKGDGGKKADISINPGISELEIDG